MEKEVEQARKEQERGREETRGRPTSRSPVEEPRKKRSVVEIMESRAKARADSDRDSDRRKRRKKRKKKKESRKKAKDLKDTSSSESESKESSSSHFHTASARGGELWRVAQKKPGRLAQKSLDEMSRYLGGRNELGGAENHWSGEKVLAYLNQVILAHHSVSQVGIRNHRELMTLAMAVDYLLEGDAVKALDMLIQRFKAVEASLSESGWGMAKHLELIPVSNAALTTEGERDMASKAELRSQKLRELQNKTKKVK